MVLSISEMRRRAEKFVEEFKEVSDERSYAQQYWRDFFNIYGIHWKDVAVFEENVKKFDGNTGFIDCFWKGKLIIEHKSEGKNLNKAYNQAIGYLDTLSATEKPRYVIVSDFKRIRLVDLYTGEKNEITLFDLPKNLQLFNFIHEKDIKHHEIQEELNIEAAELMGKLHDSLLKTNYTGYDLELLLVRLLFCVYAEDTGIFEPYQFYDYIRNEEDPTNVGTKIQKLFRILNQKPEDRQTNLEETLKTFPYVNGKLFETPIVPPEFNYEMYRDLKKICRFDWSQISPAIFGSLFQSLMKPNERRNLGAHYTSEANILKLINTLFMNELWEEFYKSKGNTTKLEKLREKMSKLKFLDPACGCGNFLITAFKELRLLEFEILKILDKDADKRSQVKTYTLRFEDFSVIKIENFYGIEIEEFPSMIARVAMWLVEHQMDLKLQDLNIKQINLPLKTSANITHGNSLRMNWEDILEPTNNVIVLGNPPFVGSSLQTSEQKDDLKEIFHDFKKYKNLDYVTAWYRKALDYIQGTEIECAFVSTNSICQGEQVSYLWEPLNNKYNFHINFAHQSFKWSNEARKNAGVYVVIIGFSLKERQNKHIFTYKTPTSLPKSDKVKRINSYLIDFDNIIISKSSTSISDIPEMFKGNQPTDGGNLLLSKEEKDELLSKEPAAEKWIKPFISAKEFLHDEKRYCLWLKDILPSELKQLPEIKNRVDNVREKRLKSRSKSTREYAEYPTIFTHDRQPETDYLLIPSTTSERREYVPMDFFSKDVIVSNSSYCIPNATLYHFGILNSKMHMTWLKYVCGRLKGDYRYTNTIVYNTYPFPEDVKDIDKEKIIQKSKKILEIRKQFSDEELGNLYDLY